MIFAHDRHPAAICAELRLHDWGIKPEDRSQHFACLRVPEANVISAHTENLLSIRAEQSLSDRFRVPKRPERTLASDCVPKANGLILARGEHLAAIGAE